MDLTDFFINIFIILFLLFVNAFFVAAEFSLVKVRNTRLEQLCNEGNSNAKKALKLVNDVNRMLAAAQLGVTIASIALGWVAESTIVQIIEPFINIFTQTATPRYCRLLSLLYRGIHFVLLW